MRTTPLSKPMTQPLSTVRRSSFIVIATMALTSSAFRSSGADVLDEWTQREPLPTGNTLESVAYGNGAYVAVGGAGTFLTSIDGATWHRQPPISERKLYGACFGNGLFVTVGSVIEPGSSGPTEAAIFTSPEGSTWTSRSSGVSNTLYRVTYGNGRFIATGEAGAIAISTNGINWSAGGNTGIAASLRYGICAGAGLFVAVGFNGTIRTSPDGASWTPRSSGTTEHLLDVAYGQGIFVATGFAGTILTSPDGITWTQRVSGTGRRLFSITYGDGLFVTFGFGVRDDTGTTVLSSPDGIRWTTSAPPTPTVNPYRGLGFGNGQFILVGAIGLIATSPTGGAWTQRSAPPRVAPSAVAYGNGTWVAVGVDTKNGAGILTSTNATRWTQREPGVTTDQIFGVGYGLDQFVAVGTTGLILTSTDGAVWRRRVSGTTFNLGGVASGHGLLVVCGTDFTSNPWRGTILTSTNGSNWTTRLTQSGSSFEGVTFGNGVFVAVGLGGTIRISTNGIHWSARTSGTTAQLFSVAFGNGQFVAVSDNSSVVTSPDGLTWTPRATGLAGDALLYTVRYGGGVFVACGEGPGAGPIYTSPDGIRWTLRRSGLDSQINGLAFGDGKFVAAGAGSLIACDLRPRFDFAAVSNDLARFSFVGVPGLNYAVDTSTNLVDWIPLTNVVATDGLGAFAEENPKDVGHRFYRVRYP